MRNEEVPTPTACAASRVRIGARHLTGSRSTCISPARCEQAGDGGGRRTRIPALSRPAAFQAVPAPWLVHPPHEEGGLLESQHRSAASASNGARPLTGSPSISTVPGIRTPTTRALNAVPLPFGLGRHESDRPDSNRSCKHGELACLPLTLRSHGALERGAAVRGGIETEALPGGRESAAPPPDGRRSVLHGYRHDLGPVLLGYLDSNQEPCAPEAPALPNCAIPHRPRCPYRAPRKYTGRDSNPHTTRFELASFPGLALPARAPPQDRTEYPSIKSRVLHRYSSRRLERMAGVEPA
jgi:hypothetical protein